MTGIVRGTGSASRRVEAAPRKRAEDPQGRVPGSEAQTPFGRKESGAAVRLLDEGPMGLGLLLDADAGALRKGGQGEVVARRRQRGSFFLRPGGGDDGMSTDERKTGDQGMRYPPPGPNSKPSTQYGGKTSPTPRLLRRPDPEVKYGNHLAAWQIPEAGARVPPGGFEIAACDLSCLMGQDQPGQPGDEG